MRYVPTKEEVRRMKIVSGELKVKCSAAQSMPKKSKKEYVITDFMRERVANFYKKREL